MAASLSTTPTELLTPEQAAERLGLRPQTLAVWRTTGRYGLLTKPLGRLLGGRLSDPARRFLERLREWYGAGEEFTALKAAMRERSSKSSVKGWIRELAQAGFLNQTEAAKGRLAAKWELAADGEEETTAYLPTCEQLFLETGCPLAHKQQSEGK